MTDTQSNAEVVQLSVDGEPVVARPGELLIDACERSGVYIPRFCYHPRMAPVGMCRMCWSRSTPAEAHRYSRPACSPAPTA